MNYSEAKKEVIPMKKIRTFVASVTIEGNAGIEHVIMKSLLERFEIDREIAEIEQGKLKTVLKLYEVVEGGI